MKNRISSCYGVKGIFVSLLVISDTIKNGLNIVKGYSDTVTRRMTCRRHNGQNEKGIEDKQCPTKYYTDN